MKSLRWKFSSRHETVSGDYIAQRNMRRCRRFIGLVLFQMGVTQANFVLIVKPILIIRTAAHVEDPLLEALFGPRLVVFIRPSAWCHKVMGKMRRLADNAAPGIDYFFNLILENFSREAEIAEIFVRHGHGLLQQM